MKIRTGLVFRPTKHTRIYVTKGSKKKSSSRSRSSAGGGLGIPFWLILLLLVAIVFYYGIVSAGVESLIGDIKAGDAAGIIASLLILAVVVGLPAFFIVKIVKKRRAQAEAEAAEEERLEAERAAEAERLAAERAAEAERRKDPEYVHSLVYGPADSIVYVSKTGMIHNGLCRYVTANNCKEMTRKEAEDAGYCFCAHCW